MALEKRYEGAIFTELSVGMELERGRGNSTYKRPEVGKTLGGGICRIERKPGHWDC